MARHFEIRISKFANFELMPAEKRAISKKY